MGQRLYGQLPKARGKTDEVRLLTQWRTKRILAQRGPPGAAGLATSVPPGTAGQKSERRVDYEENRFCITGTVHF